MRSFRLVAHLAIAAAAAGCADDPTSSAVPTSPGERECATNADCFGRLESTSPCMVPACQAGSGVCALVPLAAGAPCEDGDACRGPDSCAAGACQPGALVDCNDDETCTADSCSAAGGCVHVSGGEPCDDGDACTAGDACTETGCRGDPLSCDDQNPCTHDACDTGAGCVNVANAAPCDDGDPCTTSDACAGGACTGAGALDCDDGNACTDDACVAGDGCQALATTAACDDGSACTTGDACLGSGCAGAPIDCDDGTGCTLDSCDAKAGCGYSPSAAPCDDGDACTTGDGCAGGACTAAAALECDDGNACTDDGCDAVAGCTHSPNSAPCDDGSACTSGEACHGGACTGGSSACECAADLDCAAFDDGDACNGTLVCVASGCVVGAATVVKCPPAGGACLAVACDPASGACVTAPVTDGAPCSDGDLCTAADACAGGVCTGAAWAGCDDGNPCTTDACAPALGCTHAAATAPCDDGDACTGDGACSGTVCAPGPPLACGDGNPCTKDACVDGTCTHAPADLPCNDGDLCTIGDACVSGSCAGGPPASCDDANPCTADGCAASTGCTHAPAPGPCGPVSPCLAAGMCSSAGTCLAGPPIDCDDGAACTADTCQAGMCVHTATAGACDDGNPCTTGECVAAVGCVQKASGTCDGCAGLDCLPCSQGAKCAPEGPFLPGTCCAPGDALVYLGSGVGAEVVDVEVDGTFAYLCGGFGVRINNIQNPSKPAFAASALQRCQRIGIGPLLPDGRRVVWFAHHGDTWVDTPFLATYRIGPSGKPTSVHLIQDKDVHVEGLAWHKSRLYVAAHAGGLRTYTTDAVGAPSLKGVTTGLVNAWKLASSGDTIYVADGEGGLGVVSVASPDAPQVVASVATSTPFARDVAAAGGRVFVALGGGGVDVFDAAAPAKPKLIATLDTLGSAQAVSAADGLLAVAAWQHLAVYDSATLTLLGTEDVKLYPEVEQDFAVALASGIAYVGEWEGLHTVQVVAGRVAPDLRIDQELLSFGAGAFDEKIALVHNRGLLDLEVTAAGAQPNGVFAVEPKSLSVPPGGVDLLTVTFTPPAGAFDVLGKLTLFTNDPDPGQNPFTLHLVATAGAADLDVGDALTPNFGFLDPTGANQMANLKGKVLVLAYFALF